MMSQIVMSICTGSPPFGLSASSFLETFAPKVTMYRSSYSFRTYRLMREVLPTACSPTKHTFTFIRRGSIMTMRRRRGAKILSARAICEGLFSRFVVRWRRERIERILRGRLPAVQIPEARYEFETKRPASHEGRLSKHAEKGSPAASRRVRDPEETPPDLDRPVIDGRIAEGESSNRNPISPLR